MKDGHRRKPLFLRCSPSVEFGTGTGSVEATARSEGTRSVLVVDDDPLFVRAFARRFHAHGFNVEVSLLGQSAIEKLWEWRPDIVVSDLALPDVDGVTVCQFACGLPRPPIVVIVSGHREVGHRIRAFEAGAHDFMLKPVDFAELLARIAVHQRGKPRETQVLTHANVALDVATGLVTVGGLPVELPPALLALLACLLGEPGRIFTFEELRRALGSTGGDGVIRKHVEKLRALLGGAGSIVVTIRGVGYCAGVPRLH